MTTARTRIVESVLQHPGTGAPLCGQKVTIRLNVGGYIDGGTVEKLGTRTVWTALASDPVPGKWSVALEVNDDIDPAGTSYSVKENGEVKTFVVQYGDGSPTTLRACLVVDPANPNPLVAGVPLPGVDVAAGQVWTTDGDGGGDYADQQGGGGGAVDTVFGREGDVVATEADYEAFYDLLGAAEAAQVAAIAAADTYTDGQVSIEATARAAAIVTATGALLAKAQNLADLPDIPLSRTHLGLGDIATHSATDFVTPAQQTAALAALVGAAPTLLDTLAEIDNAIGNDPNFATTISTALATKAADSAVVHNTGTETIAGVKTFSSSPVVPDGSFAQAKVSGLVAALAALVPATRQVTAGSGLTGGGDLSADRSLAIDFGSGHNQARRGDDAAYTDARTPTAHKSTHATGGSDALTAADVGAAAALTPTSTKTGAYNAVAGDMAMMNVAGGGTVLNLPAAPANKTQVGIVAIGATSSVPLTINRGGADTISTSGATSVSLQLSGEVVVYQYDAANTRWLAVSNVKGLTALDARYVNDSLFTAKGDQLGVTGPGTVVRHAIGADGTVQTADSTQTDGWKWAPVIGGLGVYGDGSDGSITFDGTTTVFGLVPSGSIYNMNRDLYLANGTINSGVTLRTNGYRIFATGTFTNNGTIHNNGTTAVSSAAGGGAPVNSYGSGLQNGAAGGTGAGSAATGSSASLGGNGGAGGLGSSGAGGAGAVESAPGTNQSGIRNLPSAITATSNGATVMYRAGGGGGGGGGDGTNAGGGGGGGAGALLVAARTIAGTGVIQTRGGGGFSPTVGNTGGGGGAGGGFVVVVSSSVSAGALTGQTVDANGGAAGTGHGTGANGTAGAAGTVVLLQN